MTRNRVSFLGAAGALLVALAAAGCSRENGPAPMVTVPLVTQTNVVRAYDLLHAAGLRVAILSSFSADSLRIPIAQEQSPRPGTLTAAGSVATISAGFGPTGSAAVLTSMPTATVPNFVGKPPGDAVAWAERSSMFWAVRDLTPLSASDAPHFFDNYRVVRQRPLPGATLRQGVTVPGKFPGFRPTPITVWVEPR